MPRRTLHAVAGSGTPGCRVNYLRLQAPSHTVAGAARARAARGRLHPPLPLLRRHHPRRHHRAHAGLGLGLGLGSGLGLGLGLGLG
eukprot:scaffold36276_cov50-Phaeocystis_antarctica.AAC.1